MTVAERLAEVRSRIAAAAERSGRDPSEVTLVSVSKKQPAESIVAAHAAGCRDFGENYVQELADKAGTLAGDALAGDVLRWHFIGHLQRNKANALLAIPGLALVHGIESPRLVAALDRRAERPLDVLIQVDVAGEESKSGCRPGELDAVLDAVAAASHVRACGLMTMPPFGDPEQARPHFAALRELRDAHGGAARLPELSMGMSNDFEIAIEEGATLVRVGSAIFGARG